MYRHLITLIGLGWLVGCFYTANLGPKENGFAEQSAAPPGEQLQPSIGKMQAPVTITGQIGDVAAALVITFPIGGTDVLLEVAGEEGLLLSKGAIQRELTSILPGEQIPLHVGWQAETTGQLVVNVSGIFQGAIQHKVQVFRIGPPPAPPAGLGAGKQLPNGLAPAEANVIPLPAVQTTTPRANK